MSNERDDSYKADKMRQAWNKANEVPGHDLADQVQQAFAKSYPVESLRAVKEQIDTISVHLGRTFWRLCGSYLDNSAEKQEFVRLIRERQPKPQAQPVEVVAQPARVDANTDWAPTDALSDALQRAAQITREDVPA